MLVYPSGLDLSTSHLRFLTARIREHRRAIGSRWRQLSAGRQSLLTLAHLRNAHPDAPLAAGFGIGTTTAYRYITEAVDLLAALSPTLEQAVREASRKAFVLLDGTLLPIDRIAADRPLYSGNQSMYSIAELLERKHSPLRSERCVGLHGAFLPLKPLSLVTPG